MRGTMSARTRIKAILGLTSSDDASAGLDELRDLLAEREATLNLTAVYGEPYPNMQDEPTVVFPYTLKTGDGDDYGAGAKEFALPDNGLADPDAPLTKFIGKRHGISPDDVDFEALASIEGTSAPARLTDEGDVVVGSSHDLTTESDDSAGEVVEA